MANQVIEKHPDAAIPFTEFDFTDELPDDAAVAGAVTAVDANNVAASSVVGVVAAAGMIVSAVLQAGINGQDYLVTFKATGATTGQIAVKQLEMRVRTKVTGSL